MLARCTHCENTFVTQQFGRQRCPKCGTEVFIEDPRPGAYTPPQTSVEPPPPTEPVGELSPWERREELGAIPALVQTIGRVMGNPGAFFSGLRYDVDHGGLVYFALIGVIPAVFDFFYQWLLVRSMAGSGRLKDSMNQIVGDLRGSLPNYDQLLNEVDQAVGQASTGKSLVLGLVERAAIAMLLVFVAAGIPHLVLTVFGVARGHWTASLKATVYSATPLLLMLFPIPCCAQVTALTWATGLQIFSYTKAHRISAGTATAAVIAFHAIALTCACCGGSLFGGGGGAGQLPTLQ